MFNNNKWNVIHGPLKSMVRTLITGAGYIIGKNIINKKSDLKSNELKRLWSAWDIAFEKWQKELSIKDYCKSEIYQILVKGRNIAFTIIDNDGPYLKLLYQLLKAWNEVKEDDKYLK